MAEDDIDSHNINSEVLQVTPSTRDTEITQFIKQNVAQRAMFPNGVRRAMFIGEYYPIWGKEPEKALPFLRRVLEEVAEMSEAVNGKKPVFLDLGSGDGTVAIMAAQTEGYSEVHGVELQQPVNDWAKTNVKKAEGLNLVNTGQVDLHTVSYYTKRHWPQIKSKYEAVNGSTKISDTPNALDESNLLDADGKLRANVIFWFPSDPYLGYSKNQWDEIISVGTILILGPSNQVGEMRRKGILDNCRHIKRVQKADAAIGDLSFFDIYQRVDKNDSSGS